MEFTPELLAAVSGVVMFALTELSKKLRLPLQTTLLVLSVLAGVAYVVYMRYVPTEARSAVVTYAAASLGYATAIYNWLMRSMKKGA